MANRSILPFLFVFILYKLKIISALTLDNREVRFLPQTFSSVCYLILTLFFIIKLGGANVLSLVMITNTLSLLIITVITKFWKISTHTSGAMGFMMIAGILFFKYPSQDFVYPFIVISFLSLSVCAARLYLRAHTMNQILAGCFLGIVLSVSVFYFL